MSNLDTILALIRRGAELRFSHGSSSFEPRATLHFIMTFIRPTRRIFRLTLPYSTYTSWEI